MANMLLKCSDRGYACKQLDVGSLEEVLKIMAGISRRAHLDNVTEYQAIFRSFYWGEGSPRLYLGSQKDKKVDLQ